VPNKGDNAWLMVSTAFVILMCIPGLALFYGGLVRAKNMLSVLLQVFAVFSLISVLWVLYGYSIAFTEGSAFFGGLDKAFLKGITPDSVAATFSKGVVISEYIYVAFQGAFAAITVALILGAFAERIKFSAVLLFAGALVHLQLPAGGAHGVVLGGPGCLHLRRSRRCGQRDGRLPVPEGRPRLRRRHRGAHQRRRGRPGRCLHGGQADRLRSRILRPAQPDPDHRRRGPAVGGLVRLQRRLRPRSQRRRRPGLREYLVATAAAAFSWLLVEWLVKGKPSGWVPRPVPSPAWWRSPRRPASSARWARS
jgi:hypothetical protein